MKKSAFTFAVFILPLLQISAQDTLIMPKTGNGGIFNSCYAVIYDNGLDSNYQNNSHSTITIAPLWVQHVDIYFEEFNTEIHFDSLNIYDGPGTTFPLIGSYSGNALLGQTISSTGNAITLEFRSDDIQTGTGFKARVSCLMNEEILNDHPSAFVYPNPASHSITVSGIDPNKIQNMYITDITGRSIPVKLINESIDVFNLPMGTYHLSVFLTNGETYHFRWIRQ